MKITTFVASSDADFDENNLYPIKQSMETIKGGIYYEDPSTALGVKTLYPSTSIVNTRSPTSLLTVQTMAA